VNAGHTCGWSVSQGNAAVAMPMIRLRTGGWHHPAGTTGGPWQPLRVDQVLSRTCQAPGHTALCWLSQTACCRPRTRMVQWCHVWRWQPRQCTSQSVMAFADSAQGVCYPRRCCSLEFMGPDNRKCASSENQTLSRKSGTATWIDFCRKYASTINIFCSVVHGISKVKFGRLLEH